MSTDSTFHFNGEDHTLGVILQREILKHPDTTYVAYRVPHPLTRSMEVRVQAMKSAKDVVDTSLQNSLEQLEEVKKAFNMAIDKWNTTKD